MLRDKGVTVPGKLGVAARPQPCANPDAAPDDLRARVEDNGRVATTGQQMRIVILGNAGSGKSTLAKSLARTQRMPWLDLDTLVWEPDRVAVQRPDELVFADLAQFCRESDDWVIDGCYGDLVEAVLRHRPMLIFLEPGQDVCVANCRTRPWEPHKYRTKADQDAYLEQLLAWVTEFYERGGSMSQAAHRAVYEGYAGAKCRLASRAEAGEFLRAVAA